MDIDRELVAAPAVPLVLVVLSEGESYGYAILRRVRELSGSEFEWPDGLVYPVFHRLRRLGYLTSEWRVLPEGRRRRFYAITEDGRTALARRHRGRVVASRAPGCMGEARLGCWREAWSLRSRNAASGFRGSHGAAGRAPVRC